MLKTKGISVIELKRLLVDLKDKRPDIGVRFRVIGDLWDKNFASIVLVTDRGVILNDESNANICTIPDLKNVIQFEIDGPFQNFQPYNHYDVNPFCLY
ncbi:MAG TPA: hypothetical protein VEB86_01555 [Chryseosolibacter sp.]|nr:hypothetical protein [Chryseosolibacter sp.]